MSYSEERYQKRRRRVEEMEKLGVDESFYQKELRRRKGEDVRRPDDGVHHSGAYHRYFEGYSEQRILAPDGRHTRIRRVYVGERYRRSCGRGGWLLWKAVYALLFLAAAAVYAAALVMDVGSNRAWYVALPGLCSVVPMLMLLAKLAGCTVSGRDLMIYEYKYVFGRVYRWSMISAVFLAVGAVMKALYLCLNWASARIGDELLSLLGLLFGCALLLVLGLLERNARYQEIPGTSPPKDSVVL